MNVFPLNLGIIQNILLTGWSFFYFHIDVMSCHVKICHITLNDIMSCHLFDGHLSDPFPVSIGVPQGSRAARLITGSGPSWLSLQHRRDFHKCMMVYKCCNSLAPSYLEKLFKNSIYVIIQNTFVNY